MIRQVVPAQNHGIGWHEHVPRDIVVRRTINRKPSSAEHIIYRPNLTHDQIHPVTWSPQEARIGCILGTDAGTGVGKGTDDSFPTFTVAATVTFLLQLLPPL
jgi:hypothetical protein